jgi:hypothetical protein
MVHSISHSYICLWSSCESPYLLWANLCDSSGQNRSLIFGACNSGKSAAISQCFPLAASTASYWATVPLRHTWLSPLWLGLPQSPLGFSLHFSFGVKGFLLGIELAYPTSLDSTTRPRTTAWGQMQLHLCLTQTQARPTSSPNSDQLAFLAESQRGKSIDHSRIVGRRLQVDRLRQSIEDHLVKPTIKKIKYVNRCISLITDLYSNPYTTKL